MSNKITPKVAALSVLYIILLLPFAKLLEIGYEWLLNHVVLRLIDWFNDLHLVFKVLLFFFQGFVVVTVVLGLFKGVGSILSLLIFNKLPENNFTVIFSSILYLINVVLWIIGLWEITPPFTFWIFLEFCMLVWFILSVNTILLPWYIKQKAERDTRQRMAEESFKRLRL